ncbi:hypothetical protein CE91St36_14010 [Christensenellaceae bacterium]|nr:hypothetical protein CE91St36_14010 [Christensenellaceae bacterium]BDF61252.1 hypothetical protein CE91St37_14020 [Christensenellaceae bacterium]
MKRLWTILLAGLLCLGLLAGCAPAEQPSESPDMTTGEALQTSAPASASVSPTSSAPESAGAQVTEEPSASVSARVKEKSDGSAAPRETGNRFAGSNTESGAAVPQETANTPESTPQQAKTITCTISIDCAAALNVDPDLANAVSSSGTILESKRVTLGPEATVYDALKATGITFSGKSYISSINSIGEGDCGSGSGWMYSVNGDYPSVGCTKYTLSDGDNIRWRYTCDMGADIGA